MIAMANLDTLIDPPQIRGWLKTVALRRAVRKIRWTRVRARFGLQIDPNVGRTRSSLRPTRAPKMCGSRRAVQGAREDARRAAACLVVPLPPAKKPSESVASYCGCSLATAKRRIAAAQERINEELSDE